MAVADKLKEQGWYLTDEGLNQLGITGNIAEIKNLVRKALDIDLREISSGSFPEEIGKGKLDNVPGKIIVQIQKIRNISAPKANEESQAAPRMLKLSLSDGQICCQAIEVEHISAISLNTPPGTKLFLKNDVPMAHGFLLLKPAVVDVLGGKVPHLVEKWELNRSLAKHTRGRVGEEGGPPPWIPFGEKIIRINTQDRNFKSLEHSKDKENRENTEFESQRKDAIAEAARGGAKKIFGGGNKPLLDHNVQQIVDHGFTIEQAEYALRLYRNNIDRALKSLQRREGERRGDARNKEDRGERRKRGVREDESGAPPKPSGKVTLFDFFEDKLPVQSEKDQETRNASNGGGASGAERRLHNSDQQRSTSNNKTNRTERQQQHQQQQQQQQQQRRVVGRGSGNNSRGRGGSVNTAQNTWTSNEVRGGGGGGGGSSGGGSNVASIGFTHREERQERNRQGNSISNSMTAPPPQKPPRFQNQQRMQQQQQQSLNHEGGFNHQSWLNSYNDSFNNDNWAINNSGTPSNGKIRDDYSNHGDNYLSSNFENGRNGTRLNYSAGYDMSLEEHMSHDLGVKVEQLNNSGRQFVPKQEHLSHKLSSLQNQNSLGRDGFGGYTGRVQGHQNQQDQLYNMNYSYKDASETLGNSADLNASPVYNSGGGGVYSGSSNHFLPEQKHWQWQEGDKCMAKYWEDNMYYNAEVTGVSERTCVVRFVEYGNFEEVLQDHCIPVTDDELRHSIQSPGAFNNSADTLSVQNNNQNHFSGVLEFRRGGTRPYVKSTGSGSTVTAVAADRKPPRAQQQMYVPPAQRK